MRCPPASGVAVPLAAALAPPRRRGSPLRASSGVAAGFVRRPAPRPVGVARPCGLFRPALFGKKAPRRPLRAWVGAQSPPLILCDKPRQLSGGGGKFPRFSQAKKLRKFAIIIVIMLHTENANIKILSNFRVFFVIFYFFGLSIIQSAYFEQLKKLVKIDYQKEGFCRNVSSKNDDTHSI